MKKWLFAAALVAAVFLAYQPAWQGGPVWDDDAHLTRPELRSWHGLYRIWFDVGATLQYYPFVHSVFWMEHKLWCDATLGYHLVNLLLHAVAALMVAAILRRLAIPGAYLAAAIFALHPVQVESVAWITELKNTLSGVLYLGSAMLYFRFDESRKIGWYFAALGLFLLALLTKTVTATLPGALLVIFWWQRGRLSLRSDVLPLTPFFLLGAGMGMTTAWWELKLNHCDGPDFEFTRVERILIAGRGVWFHLEKLLWPANLTFIYPRWQIDAHDWRQYLYPVCAAALLVGAWAMRKRTRAPLAALLFFGGTLFPVMGFFNLYTYRYSFIADHYQYLACLGIITLFSTGLTLLPQALIALGVIKNSTPIPRKAVHAFCCAGLLAVLSALTWHQSQMYANAETLLRATIANNPACWMAHTNLGIALADQGRFTDAIAEYQEALCLKPDDAETRYNLGNAWAGCGRTTEAIGQYGEALRIRPDFVAARYNLGIALAHRGQINEAVQQYTKALDIDPNFAPIRVSLGVALAGRKEVGQAIEQFQKALAINPDYAEAHFNLGVAFAGQGKLEDAINELRKALAINPDYGDAHYGLAVVCASFGRADEAVGHFRSALSLAAASHNMVQVEEIRARMKLLQASSR